MPRGATGPRRALTAARLNALGIRHKAAGRTRGPDVLPPRQRTALQNAASIAGLLLTTEAVVVEKQEVKPAPAAPPGGGRGGMY